MPLVVVTGLPSSGKSLATQALAAFLREQGREVEVVAEAELLGKGASRDQVFSDSAREKEVRARTKAEVARLLSREKVVICDAGNYIKGFRYELYCLSKASKTTQATLWCDLSLADCLAHNTAWGRGVLEALAQRYEAPQEASRWDSPLFLVLKDRPVPCKEVADSLFNLAPPPPNLSTQNKPLSSTSFLHELDQMCGEIVQAVLTAQRLGEGEVNLGLGESLVLGRHYTLPELARHKRQFLVYVKQRAVQDLDKLRLMFLQYLGSNLTS